MSRLAKRLCLAIAVAAATLVIIDLAIGLLLLEEGRIGDRPLPPFGATPHPQQRAWLVFHLHRMEFGEDSTGLGMFDPELGWIGRPSGSTPGGAQRTNRLGARGAREYAGEKPAETLRLLCFGDSYTYSSGVGDAEAWPAQLEARRPDVEAINFGLGGYGTDQALLRYRRVRDLGLGAEAVLIGMLVENIGRNVNRYRPLYYPSAASTGVKPRFVLSADGNLELVKLPYADERDWLRSVEDGSVLELLSEHEYWREPRLRVLRHSSLVRLAAGWCAYARRQARAQWNDPGGEPFRITLALLETFHREALAGGASAAPVLVFPREKEMEALATGDRYWQPLLDALDELGIPHLDLSDSLLGPWRAGRAGELYRRGHLTPLGNRIVAERVDRWLSEHLALSGEERR